MAEHNGVASYDDLALKVMSQDLQLQQSDLMSRASFARMHGLAFGGERDYYEVLGYNKHLTPQMYYLSYLREGIATRIVTAYPDETWRLHPKVYEDDTENETPFEAMWCTMERKLRIFHYMHRADVEACLGRFSVLFIGFNDASTVESLARPVSKGQGRAINYLSCYGDRHVKIVEMDRNILSPRFGLPLTYEIDFDRGGVRDKDTAQLQGKIGCRRVHWERVIHFADDLLDDDVYGTPKLQGIWNYLQDMMKVVGGGGETFWRNARKDLIIEANEDAHLSKASRDLITEQLEEYIHNLRASLAIEGATAKTLPVQVASPADHFNCIIQLISGSKGIPKRILLGSEMGELSSTQDGINWAQNNGTRQLEYAEPTALRPFIDRCITTGVMPTPKSGPEEYTIEWQPLIAQDEMQKANRIVAMTNALSTYSNGSASAFFPLAEYRVNVLEWEEESPYETEQEIDARESANDDEPVSDELPIEDDPEAEDEEYEDA